MSSSQIHITYLQVGYFSNQLGALFIGPLLPALLTDLT